MTVTADMIIQMPDVRVEEGMSRFVKALIEKRDRDIDFSFDEDKFELDTEAGKAFEARLTTRMKEEDHWDLGDGWVGVGTVEFDGVTVAVMTGEGYDDYSYEVALLDRPRLDHMVACLKALRRNSVRSMDEVAPDADIAELLGLNQAEVPSP